MLPFRQGTPYQGEDLIYDADGAGQFPGALQPQRRRRRRPACACYVRRIGEADVTVRFLRDWLADWRPVAGNIEQLIAKLRPPGA